MSMSIKFLGRGRTSNSSSTSFFMPAMILAEEMASSSVPSSSTKPLALACRPVQMRPSANALGLESDQVKESANDDLAADHADGAGERAGLGENLVGGHANVVPAAGSRVGHAGDDRLFAAPQLVPDEIARERRAAGAI